jgi:polar amino acid transport system permease protein
VSTADTTGNPVATERPDELEVVPVRHRGRWISAAVILIIVASLVRSVVTNDRFQWDVVRQYLFDSQITHGVVVTLELTVISMVIGVILGVLVAVMRLSQNPIVTTASWIYIWVFRGTPVLVQVIFWFYIAALYPSIDLGVPFGPSFIHINANTTITAFMAAILAFGINEGAYMSEIVRAGILSVDEGQQEAASALGMSRLQTMRRVVLPQAMRVIVPPTGNETISMLKTTSLVIVIGAVHDILFSASIIYARTYQTIPLLIVASIWYLFITSIMSVGQYYIERRYARGSSRNLPETPIQKLKRVLFSNQRQPPPPPDETSPPPLDVQRNPGSGGIGA